MSQEISSKNEKRVGGEIISVADAKTAFLTGIVKSKILKEYKDAIEQCIQQSSKDLDKVIYNIQLKDNKNLSLKIKQQTEVNKKKLDLELHRYYINKTISQYTDQIIKYNGINIIETENNKYRIESLYESYEITDNFIDVDNIVDIMFQLSKLFALLENIGVSFMGIKLGNIIVKERNVKLKLPGTIVGFFQDPQRIFSALHKSSMEIIRWQYSYYVPHEINNMKSPFDIVPQKVDAYSFGIIFAELLLRQKKNSNITCFIRQVIETQAETIELIDKLKNNLGETPWLPLIINCLNFESAKRPKFEDIIKFFNEKQREKCALNPIFPADTYKTNGELKYNTRKYESAIYYYELYLKYINLLNNDCITLNEIYHTYANLAFSYNFLGNYQKSICYLQFIANYFIKNSTKEIDLAKAYLELSEEYIEIGNPTLVNQYFQEAQKILEKFPKENIDNSVTINIVQGRAYICLGHYSSAKISFQKALDELTAKPEAKDVNIGIIHNNIGIILKETGYYVHSVNSFVTAMNYLKKTVHIAKTDINLGVVYDKLGKQKEAMKWINKGKNKLIKTFGIYHPEVGKAFYSLGITYYNLGEYNTALEYLKKSLKIKKKLRNSNINNPCIQTNYKNKHPELVQSYNSLGLLYCVIGQYKKAHKCLEKAGNMATDLYQEHHPDIATNLNNKGFLCFSLGKYKEAINFYQKAISARQHVVGEEHSGVAEINLNLGDTFAKIGNYIKAKECLHRSEQILLKVFGEDHLFTAMTYNSLGKVYCLLENYKRAGDYLQKAEKIITSIYGDKHLELSVTYNNFGLCFCKQSDCKRGIEYFKKAEQINSAKYGSVYPIVARTYNNIGSAYLKNDEPKKAECYYKKVKPIYKKLYVEPHIDLAAIYDNLGQVYDKLYEIQKALKCYKKVVDMKGYLNDDEGLFANANYNLATVYYNLGEYDNAIESYNKAADISVKMHGGDHQVVAQVYTCLSKSYFWVGNYTKSIEFYLKIQTMKWK